MSNNNQQNVFSSLNPKTGFIIGLVVGVMLMCTVGFIILSTTVLAGRGDTNIQKTSDNGDRQVAQAPTPSPSPSALTGQAVALAGQAVALVEGRVDVKISSADHVRGDKNAPVKIVEYSDIQCPFCSKFHSTMQQVMAEYGNQVAWVYKHFPLDSLHSEARPAAEAAECIAEQAGDKGFFEFLDATISNQSRLSKSYYEEVASEIGVNSNKFKDCVDTRKYKNKVEADYQEGIKYGVTGTPGNFVNGIPAKGALPFSSIKEIIDSELN